jgi:hypothetical protein
LEISLNAVFLSNITTQKEIQEKAAESPHTKMKYGSFIRLRHFTLQEKTVFAPHGSCAAFNASDTPGRLEDSPAPGE